MNEDAVFTAYMESAVKQFAYYKHLGEACLERLSEKELNWQPNESVNSVATIVKHLHGNMLSRWTNFMTQDGEKPWRERDGEFETFAVDRELVEKWWEDGWLALFAALDSLKPGDLMAIVYIRNQGHSVLEAINRQLCHYSYHVGQMVHIGKTIKDKDWESLSIPKAQSKSYNESKFAEPKTREHFSDEYISDIDKHERTETDDH